MRQVRRLLENAKYKIVLTGLLASLLMAGWAGVANAQSFRSGDHTVVSADETVNSSVYIAGSTVDVAGTVNGDVFCAGQNINISGTVRGDVICAGQNVTIGGTVEGDVRLAGQSVTIKGTVDGNATVFGQNITTEGDSRIAGDAAMTGQEVTVNGTVGRDLAAGSGRLVIDGQIGRNIQAAPDQLTLSGGAVVGGDVRYTSQNEADRQSGAQVAGSISRQQPADHDQGFSIGDIFFYFWIFLAMLVLALVLVALFPKAYHAASETGLRRPGMTLLLGAVAAISVPVLIVLTALTVVGIPLAILALVAWVLICMLSGTLAAYTLGRRLLRGRAENAFWYMLAGGSVLLVAYYLPFIGWLIGLLVLWFGIGLILWQFKRLPARVYGLPAAVAKPPKSAKQSE